MVLQHAARRLRDVESVVLERHRSALQGSVLELVPGGSRLTEELVHQARSYTGVSPSPTVVNVCRQMYLAGHFELGEIDALEQFPAAGFEVVFAGRCAIDTLGGERRRAMFEGVLRVLTEGGLLIFSSHNAAAPELQQMVGPSPHRQRGGLMRGLRLRSSRAPMDDRELGQALRSGIDGDVATGPYRITREAQAAELQELGLELLECIDLDGHQVPPDGPGSESPELHYVTRRAAAGAPGPDGALKPDGSERGG